MVLLHFPSARTKYVVLPAVVGETDILLPVPTGVPPHDPLYHFQDAACPRLPPFTVSVVELPRQIVPVPVIDVAGTEVSCTTMLILAQEVLLQVPSALRKYVVVTAGATFTEFPLANNVVPQPAVYQLHTAPAPRAPPLGVRVVVLPKQMVSVSELFIAVAAELGSRTLRRATVDVAVSLPQSHTFTV